MADKSNTALDLRTRIAFRMWNSTNPPHIAAEITPERFAEIETPIGDGWTMSLNLKLDWDMNKETFQRLADAAIEEFRASYPEALK